MILYLSNGRKIYSFILTALFFQEILNLQKRQKRPKKKQNKTKQTNKHSGQLTCPRAQPQFQIRLAPKFQDGVTDLNFINSPDLSKKRTDRSEIEKNWIYSKTELLLKRALRG